MEGVHRPMSKMNKDARERAIQAIVARLASDVGEPEHIRHVILNRRIAEVRVGIVVIIAVMLFAMFLIFYAVLWGSSGLEPTSMGQWIAIGLMVMFFVIAWKATSIIQDLERLTGVYEEALSRFRGAPPSTD